MNRTVLLRKLNSLPAERRARLVAQYTLEELGNVINRELSDYRKQSMNKTQANMIDAYVKDFDFYNHNTVKGKERKRNTNLCNALKRSGYNKLSQSSSPAKF